MTLTKEEKDKLLRRVLQATVGMPLDDAVEAFLRAYVSVSRVVGRSKDEVMAAVRDLLDREPQQPGSWSN